MAGCYGHSRGEAGGGRSNGGRVQPVQVPGGRGVTWYAQAWVRCCCRHRRPAAAAAAAAAGREPLTAADAEALDKLVGLLTKDGKKSRARRLLLDAMHIIQQQLAQGKGSA
ncbi:hypothetical protein OEZ85_000460 [Tetradesmus obliquus]|uniref:Uncharacterized protein n=1 Tax=Tetradesmus obliquus TaxID=3088 RepID=A0ABY8UI81_TETOB|nr:hypothetical protein OEZ85_000460 [Tetradesmus obliquus]